jgi:hypothetical protein
MTAAVGNQRRLRRGNGYFVSEPTAKRQRVATDVGESSS